MLEKIISFSVNHKIFIGLAITGMVAWGVFSMKNLAVDAVPDITNNQVQVITVSPSLAAEEVERQVTFPVELAIATIPGIEEVRSFSRFGLSIVTIVFEDGVDIYWGRQQVSERLVQAGENIPPGSGKPELAPLTTGLGEIYQYTINVLPGFENQYSLTELRTIQDWIVRRQLLGTKGVADVSSFGGHLKQYEIALDPARLNSFNISIADVFRALENNNQNTGGAFIDKKPYAWFIRTEGQVKGIEDIENIAIKPVSSGVPLLIRDVAEVRAGSAVRYGAMTVNNEGETVGAIVLMLKGENSSEVISEVKKRIEAINQSLPEGLVIEPFLDRTKLVDNAIATVSKNLVEGALIVILVLIILLGNVRAGLLVASVIPLSMLFAFIMMNLFGVSGNLMSLGAIDFGIIVDGAVIIVEIVVHQLNTSPKYRDMVKLPASIVGTEVKDSANRMMRFAIFGQIIILIVYLPILSLKGIEGKMFKPMAETVSFALIGAMLLCLTYVPMMSALILNKQKKHKPGFSDKLIRFLFEKYHPLILHALRNKAAYIVSAIGLFLVSLFLFFRMGGEFIPTLDEGDFALEVRLMTGSSLSQSIETAQECSAILLEKFPEVVKVVGKIGSSEIPVDPMPIEALDLIVVLKDKSEWVSAKKREELAGKMSEALSVVPGVIFSFQQPIQMRFNELMTGAKQDVVVKVFGEDLEVLSELANQTALMLQKTKGAEDVYVEQVMGLPQIVVDYRRENIARHNLSIRELNNTVRSAFAGERAGRVFEGERFFDLVVRLDTAQRKSIQGLQNLYVSNQDGMQVPLAQLAEIAFKEGPAQIQREDAKRRIIIGFNVRERDVESVVNEIRGKINANLKLPDGYFVTYGGQFQNLVEARERLGIAVPLALLLILAMLFFAFGSVKYALLVFTAIPLAAIGGVFSLLVRGMPFSISAGVGFIALFGVAVLNGIVLIGQFNQLRKSGLKNLHRVVLKGTEMRLRPVLMTALVASLGFLPMALSQSAGAEVQRPLATVVIGGLVSSTLLTLFILPLLYILLHKIPFKFRKPFAVIPFLLSVPCLANAQDTQAQPENKMPGLLVVSLEDVAKMAMEKNRDAESARRKADYFQSLKGSSTDLGRANLQVEYGQINSSYNQDSKLELTQAFPFPTVLRNQHRLSEAEFRLALLNAEISEMQASFLAQEAYFQMLYLQELHKLLERQAEMYERFLNITEVRLRTGETRLIEKLSAQSHLEEARMHQKQNQADQEIANLKLQAILFSDDSYKPVDTAFFKLPYHFSSGNNIQNPQFLYISKQTDVFARQRQLEKSRLFPDISLGFFNQSLVGFDNHAEPPVFYDKSDRFNGLIIGLSMPLWAKPQISRIKAAEFNLKAAIANEEAKSKQLQSDIRQLDAEIQKHLLSIDYYEKTLLPLAEQQLELSGKTFFAGESSYTEFLSNATRALSIKGDYLKLLNNYNRSVLYYNYITGKKN